MPGPDNTAATSTQGICHLPCPRVTLERLTPGTLQLPLRWRPLSVMGKVFSEQQLGVRLICRAQRDERVEDCVSDPQRQKGLCNPCVNASSRYDLKKLQNPAGRSLYRGRGIRMASVALSAGRGQEPRSVSEEVLWGPHPAFTGST